MRWDDPWVGLVAGLLAPIIGFLVYGSIYVNMIRPHLDLPYFVQEIFLNTRRYQAPIISLSLIANLPLFFLFDRFDRHKSMRGVITATFLYGIVVVVLWA